MKKTVLCLVLFMGCTLSACSLSGQDATNSNGATQSASTSQEISATELSDVQQENEMAAEMPVVYAELLDAYATALQEKWDGDALIERGLNLSVLDLYDGVPLENIGYAVMDMDGNGINELVIGTMAVVTDDFYRKMILDLYTLDQDGVGIPVIRSTARDRYFYVGEQLFANIGSSSADDSINVTMHYEGIQLSDINKATTPADYVQIDLTPLSLWSGSNATMSENTKNNESE